MKKIFASVLALALALSMFTACGKTANYDIKSVVAKIQETAPVDQPMDLDESLMADLIGVNMDNVEEFYAQQSSANTKSDIIVMIKSKKGKSADVKTDIENFKTAREEAFAMYDTTEAAKLASGRIVTKGDYVLLVVAGDNKRIENGEVDAVYAEIDTAIDEATK
ncbi:MAG: DUF4358 domain-containing protein [Oscillospiraceae bacterium]